MQIVIFSFSLSLAFVKLTFKDESEIYPFLLFDYFMLSFQDNAFQKILFRRVRDGCNYEYLFSIYLYINVYIYNKMSLWSEEEFNLYKLSL